MGESASDFLVHRIDPYIAVTLGGLGLVVALILQGAARRYVPWVYWLAVSMVAIAGTMAADVVHIKFGVPYVNSSVFFAVVLAAVFAIWYASEKTLSIHSIYDNRREVFYWATVMVTFALGTAAGDMTAYTANLGFFWSGVMFAGLIALPALAYRIGLNEILAFWLAYILTRPLGASFADWMGKPKSFGALGWGDGVVFAGLTLLIIAAVRFMTVTRPSRGAA